MWILQKVSAANSTGKCRLSTLEEMEGTVHSCVAYSSDGVQSFATISGSLWRDERAVWAHLEPVIKDVLDNRNPRPTTLHVMSDGPVTQYRNKNNFYLLSTIPFLSGFKQVTWNFSEKSHGKVHQMGLGVLSKG